MTNVTDRKMTAISIETNGQDRTISSIGLITTIGFKTVEWTTIPVFFGERFIAFGRLQRAIEESAAIIHFGPHDRMALTSLGLQFGQVIGLDWIDAKVLCRKSLPHLITDGEPDLFKMAEKIGMTFSQPSVSFSALLVATMFNLAMDLPNQQKAA